MQKATYKRLSVIACVCPHPVTILFITPLEVAHPVAEGLQSVRCQLLPNGRDVTIKKGPSDLIQLTAHTHLTSQCLGGHKRIRTSLTLVKHKDTAPCFVFPISYCPLSLLLTLCSSARERCMRTTSLLKRSSS